MKFCIITAYSRPQNLDRWLQHLREQRADITAHLLYEDPAFTFPAEPWVRPWLYKRPPGLSLVPEMGRGIICHAAYNWFLDACTVDDDAVCFTLADDDFLEPGFCAKLEAEPDCARADYIMVTMARGDRESNGQEAYPLIAASQNMRVYHCGGSQLLARGRHFKTFRWALRREGDSLLIENIWRTRRQELFVFCPNVQQWFNYLEPGRWDASGIRA